MRPHADAAPGLDQPLHRLSRLVVKQGVALGVLPPFERGLLFALVWAGLADGVWSERQMNAQLQGQLAATASCLDTDHVELRRWLVDAGWLRRDGYGRAYQCTESAELPAPDRALAAHLSTLDVQAWTMARRAEHEARRQARSLAWEQRSGA